MVGGGCVCFGIDGGSGFGCVVVVMIVVVVFMIMCMLSGVFCDWLCMIVVIVIVGGFWFGVVVDR